MNPYDGPGRSSDGGIRRARPGGGRRADPLPQRRGGAAPPPARRSPRHARPLEQQLTESANRIAQLSERNEKLVVTLRDARSQLLALKEEVDRLAQPPSGYGVFLAPVPDGSVEVFTGGPAMRLAVSPTVDGRRCAAASRSG